MKTTLVTINTPGVTTGPTFDIFSNVDLIIPLASGVAKSSLLSGYSVTNVPDAATSIRVKSIGACTTYVDLSITTPSTTTTTSTTSTTTTTTGQSWPSELFSFYYATGGINNWSIYGYGNQSSPINVLSGGQDFGSLAVPTDPAFNNFEVVTFHWYGETWAGPGYRNTLVTLTIKGSTSEPTGWSNITVNHTGTITTLPRIGPNTTVSIYNEMDGFGIYNDYVTWQWANVTPIPFGYNWSTTVDVN